MPSLSHLTTLRDSASGCGSPFDVDSTGNDFFLAQNSEGMLFSIGVRGDALGCFMAR
jgi:hypothetical protein